MRGRAADRATRALALCAALALSGCLHRPPRPAPDRVACVSDLHLGDPRSVLDDAEGRAWFSMEISDAVENDRVHTLILDGDVLELSLASRASAISVAREVFASLAAIPGLARVVVVVGNHDHALFEELPGSEDDDLGKVWSGGTTLHAELADALARPGGGSLALDVVYPDYAIPVPQGNVHFTHGHYFDPWTTPAYDGLHSFAEIEHADHDWYETATAGGTDPPTRALYRLLYDASQHVEGLIDRARHATYDQPHEGRREVARVAYYLNDVLHDPRAVGLIAGHTHDGGGFETTIRMGARDVAFYDVGAFVAAHSGRPIRPYLFELDRSTGEMRMAPLEVPPALARRAEERAFSRVP